MNFAAKVKTQTASVSPKLSEKWRGLCAALSSAAADFTGKAKFVIPPDRAYEIVGGDEEASRRLMAAPSGSWHRYSTNSNGELLHEISRWEDCAPLNGVR